MKTKLKSKLRLVRPADAFLPAGLCVAALFTHPYIMMITVLSALAVAVLSLAACRGVRVAFAAQPSIRNARGSVKAALLAQAAATLLCIAACGVFYQFDYTYTFLLPAVGLALNIEHTFYEYLYATGDGSSATMTRAITTALVTAGLILCGTNGGEAEWLVGAAGIAMLVSVVAGIAIGGSLKGKLNGAVFRAAPRALVQTLLYPAAAAAILRFGPFRSTIAPAFAGLAVYELCKTPFRRSAMEARGLNRGLLVVCAVAVALIGLSLVPAGKGLVKNDDVLLTGVMLLAAAACALALFGNFRRGEY